MINLNKLAKEVTLAEGGKQSLSIAQVKEVIRHTLDILVAEHKISEVVALLERRAASRR